MPDKLYRRYAAITADGRILASCEATHRAAARKILQNLLKHLGSDNELWLAWKQSHFMVLCDPDGPITTQRSLIS